MNDTPDARRDAAATLDLIAESQQRARTGTEPDGRLLCLVWGVAWLIGYLVLWRSAAERGVPGGPAFGIFFGLLAAAVVFTIVHNVQRATGTRGASRRAGAMWGSAWALAFFTFPFVIGGIAGAGASDDVIGLVANAMTCLIIGIMYLTGGACFGDTGLYVLGVWIMVTGAIASSVGMPATYLVMALLGGGGFLVITLGWQVLLSRRRRVTGSVGRGAAVGPEQHHD